MRGFNPGPIVEISVEVTYISGKKEKITYPRIIGIKQSSLAAGPSGGPPMVVSVLEESYNHTLDELKNLINSLEQQKEAM